MTLTLDRQSRPEAVAPTAGGGAAVPEVIASWPTGPGGEFLLGGVPLSQAVAAAGHTPCYLYDRERIAARVRDLRARLSPRVRLHYAIKANPMPALVCAMARLTDGLDVASGGELGVALDSGMDPEHISFAGPAKSEAELARAHAAGVLVNLESLREARLLSAIAARTGRPARVAIRCNLPFELKSSGMKMTGGAKQFGIEPEDLPDMFALIAAGDLRFEGFHLYAGSQNLKAEAIIEAQCRSYDQALEWLRDAPAAPRWINLGGGFGIPYAAHERPLELEPVTANLNMLAKRLERDVPGAEIVVELGRYLVGEAGLYVARVVDRKVSRGQVFLLTDGGMHHHLAASGNFGQVIRKNYPVAVNGRPGTEPGLGEIASVVGPLCTPLDLLADKAALGVADVGDLVVVFQSGAYGRTASPRDFPRAPGTCGDVVLREVDGRRASSRRSRRAASAHRHRR